ncbi:hypothetical protein [Duncaniella muris]|uniref:hypothetical protein n=1 Tax=Duncaniella muris TaxID=2094150 RepID=UPI0025AA1B0D|nr:hypothetical protein [Duncaniella muris]
MKAISIRTVVMFIFILILQSCKNQDAVNNGGAPVVNLDPGNKELTYEKSSLHLISRKIQTC